jgi:Phage integrase, N-terminal SAM-like domain
VRGFRRAVTKLATSTRRPIVSPHRYRRLRPRARRIGGLIASGLSSTQETAIDEKAGSEPLSHWLPGYWRSLQSRKPTTRVNHSTAWRLRIEPRFGTLPVRRIKASHIDDWIADMNQDGVSPTTVIEAVGVLRRVLDSRARLRSGSIWPLVSALIRVPVHFYVSRMRNQPIELAEEANMAATSS